MSMMERKFINILEDCLSRLDQGETLPEILKRYPHLAEKLRPILLVAMMSRTLPPPAPGHTALRNGKNLLLAEMNAIQGANAEQVPDSASSTTFNERVTEWIDRVTQPIGKGIGRIHPAYRLASLVLILVLTGGYLTVSASGLEDTVLGELFSGFERMGEILRFLDHEENYPEGFLPGEGFLLGNKGKLLDGYKSVYGEESSSEIQVDTDLDQYGQDDQDLSDDQTSNIVQPEAADNEEEADKEADKEEKEADKEADKEEKEADKEADKEEKEEEKEDKEDDKEEEKEDKEDDKEDKDNDAGDDDQGDDDDDQGDDDDE
jgi:hypothetical protein